MRKILLTLVTIVSLGALVACGGGSSNSVVAAPAPSGGNNAGFSNASLTGNYVYAANGFTSNYTFAVVGQFHADGNGNITSGTRDTVNDSGGQVLGESISGSYSVNQDGRGQAVLNGSSGQVIYRFVLSSTSAGKLFQNGTGSTSVLVDTVGRLEAQSTPSTTLAGPYVVRLDGEDTGLLPYGAIGGLTFTGSSISGAIDENDAGISTSNGSLAISTGTYGLATNGRGTLGYVTPNSSATTTASPQGAHNFIAYYVSSSRLELLSTDKKFFLHGYADQQAAAVAGTIAAFTGDQVFNIAGTDLSTANFYPVQETGRFTLDGAGNIANAVADYNDAGNLLTDTGFSGTYNVATSGRWQANLNYVSLPTSLGLVGWQVSPQQSLLLTTSSTLLETGTMRAQTAAGLTLTTAGVTGNYAENLSGDSGSTGYLESTGNLLASAGGLSGTIDSQIDANGLSVDAPTTGSYSFTDPTTGRGTGYVGSVPVSYYAVDPDTIYVFSTDSNSLYQGMLVAQP